MWLFLRAGCQLQTPTAISPRAPSWSISDRRRRSVPQSIDDTSAPRDRPVPPIIKYVNSRPSEKVRTCIAPDSVPTSLRSAAVERSKVAIGCLRFRAFAGTRRTPRASPSRKPRADIARPPGVGSGRELAAGDVAGLRAVSPFPRPMAVPPPSRVDCRVAVHEEESSCKGKGRGPAVPRMDRRKDRSPDRVRRHRGPLVPSVVVAIATAAAEVVVGRSVGRSALPSIPISIVDRRRYYFFVELAPTSEVVPGSAVVLRGETTDLQQGRRER